MTNLPVEAVSYDDQAIREDLLAILQNISPTETQLISGLGTSQATNIYHQTLVDTLNAVKANAQIEGAAATFMALTNPARVSNTCQIFSQGFRVSDTERSVNQAAFNDRFQYEATKAMKLIKNDMEYAAMRGTLISGSGTAARQMRGVKNSLSLITNQSATSLSEKILNDLFQLVWDNTGVQVNAVYGDMYMKRKISGFTAGATKYFTQDDRRLINAIDVYQADAASMVKLFPHRYVSISGTDTNHALVGINEDFFKIAYLRKPVVETLAKVGDSTDGRVVVEATLESQHYNAGFWAEDYL
jgi:hypothetical protein